MAKTQGTRAFMFWIMTFGVIYITGMTLSCVSGYYLPLDLCDFYFEGHRECAPMFDAISTKSNITFPASILTKDDMTVSTAHVNPKCAFLADPSMGFGLDEECSGHFHLRDKKLFGQFPVFKSHQSHQILLKFETVVLQDGTVLTPSDGSIHFLESKRCVTIFTAPVDHSEDLISTLSQMVPNMLNKEHRKKLKKLNEKVTHLRNDFTSIFHDIANFP
ncbi:unnamed protein product [Sphagnum troendelagicum]|uniref:Uncharacterized protein n=1 Tax=Sphagnum troendelagicum TaxID=128251 RepID=A0ABP0UBW4_9BRYO